MEDEELADICNLSYIDRWPYVDIDMQLMRCGTAAGFGMQRGLRLAKKHQQDWLMHIDPDEIVHPVTGSFSLAAGETHFICMELRRNLLLPLHLPDTAMVRAAAPLPLACAAGSARKAVVLWTRKCSILSVPRYLDFFASFLQCSSGSQSMSARSDS